MILPGFPRIIQSQSDGIKLIAWSLGRGSSSSAATVLTPEGTQDGDLIVALGVSGGSTAGAVAPLPDFTSLVNHTADTPQMRVAYRIASSEPSSRSWGGASTRVVSLMTFRGATSVTEETTQRSTTDTITIGGATIPAGSMLLLMLGVTNSAPTLITPPAGMSVAVPYANDANPVLAVYEQASSGGAIGSKTLVWDAATGNKRGYMIGLHR